MPSMYNNTMLKAAFKFRKAELWNQLSDNHIFAIQLPSGELGYCNVMGALGNYFGLGLYIGRAGYSSFLRMIENSDEQSLSFISNLTYDVINCNFSQANDLNFGEESKKAIRAFAEENKLKIPRKHGWPEFVRLKLYLWR